MMPTAQLKLPVVLFRKANTPAITLGNGNVYSLTRFARPRSATVDQLVDHALD
jgi:hypothetical protein